jgi:hypothetical protein
VRLGSPALAADGSFRFTAIGIQPGKTNFFQFSTNFSSWANLLTNQVGTNTFNFSDPKASNSVQRFYRVSEAP